MPPPRRKRFELAPLVAEIGDSLGLPREGTIGWKVDIEDKLEVDSDRDQLYRILSNLCRNAVQALESEMGGTGEIMIAAHSHVRPVNGQRLTMIESATTSRDAAVDIVKLGNASR